MAINFDDFVEQVRDANPIEMVLEEGGIKLRGHGRLRTGVQHDSLKVRTDMGRVFWYSMNWNGDVFAWVMREKGCDFNQALEILARRAHLDMPRFNQVNETEVKRIRATADVFSVAANVFHRWLVGDKERGIEVDKAALEYAQGRAWTEHTIKESVLGFSGRRTPEQIKDMRGEFSLYGIDPCSPAAVAVLGFEGDIGSWAVTQGIRDHEDFDPDWIMKGRIHGLMDTPGLIYSHQHQGGVKYLSRRQLPGHDKIKDKPWKSFNPYKVLAGPKQPYFNMIHRMDRALVCVEGQGDAITFGQWGQGAMAFCGLLGDPAQMAPEDGERMRKLAAFINKHPAVYLSLDDDAAGQKALKLAARLLGPKTQIVRMWEPVTRKKKSESDQSSVSSEASEEESHAQE